MALVNPVAAAEWTVNMFGLNSPLQFANFERDVGTAFLHKKWLEIENTPVP